MQALPYVDVLFGNETVGFFIGTLWFLGENMFKKIISNLKYLKKAVFNHWYYFLN